MHADLGEHVVGVAEVLVVCGGSADGAGLGGQQRVVGDAFLGEHDPDVGRHPHPEVHGLARPDLHGGAARHDLANGQRKRLDIRRGDLDLPREGGIVLGVLGLHVVVRLGDHDVVDEVPGDAHEVRVESARRDHRLRLGDDDPARIVDGLRDGEDLHLQTLVLHRQVAHLVGVRAADEPDVDRKPAVVQVLFAVQLDERDEVLRGDVVDLGALDARIDEGAQPHLGDDAGPMRGDLAVEGRHDALRQVVAFELVVGGELAQRGGGRHDSADPPLDQPLVGELAQAFALAARADGGGIDDRQAAGALPGQPSLLEGGDDFLVDAGQTEAGERDRVAVLDERGSLRRADCLGHRRSFGRSALSAQRPGSAWRLRDPRCGGHRLPVRENTIEHTPANRTTLVLYPRSARFLGLSCETRHALASFPTSPKLGAPRSPNECVAAEPQTEKGSMKNGLQPQRRTAASAGKP